MGSNARLPTLNSARHEKRSGWRFFAARKLIARSRNREKEKDSAAQIIANKTHTRAPNK
jgi:hypothetical protein